MDLNSGYAVVLDTLTRACSQDADVLKPAEAQLKEWETQPGFYSILMSIVSDHTVDITVRWLAVLYFKNGVDRYWRRNAPNAIQEEEKTHLRQQLIAKFNEPVSQIATQLAVLIGKIARLDCPRHWQELVPTLLEAVKCDSIVVQQRALLTLHHVVKMLASKRLAADRKLFEELTANVFEFVLSLWTTHTSNFFAALQQDADGRDVVTSLEHSVLTLKVLRKLAVFGFKDANSPEAVVSFIKLCFQRVEEFLKAKAQMLAVSRELSPGREKTITLLTKVLLDFQEYHPESFIQFIPSSLQLCVKYNLTEDGKGLVYERYVVNAFNLMRSILRCEVYRPAKMVSETKNPATLVAHKMKVEFFTARVLSEICQRLVLSYFPLTSEDLQLWDSDPEDFITDEGGDSWKFSLRPCTENLYLTLAKEFRLTVTPIVVELVKEYQGPVDPSDLQGILRTDAVYVAAGLASFELYDDIDFNQWFMNHLLQELQNKHTNYRIIRRRVIWLIGCWVGVKFSVDARPALYEAILPLLQPSEDLVVRLEASSCLRLAVDDFDFKGDQFLPYLDAIFGSLFVLLQNSSECETKMQVLHVMSFIIERMTIKIRPLAGSLLQYLPTLWADGAEHNMLRCAILTTLTALVEGLGVLCVNMYDFLLPVIGLSTDVTQEPHVYLCEDGLDLWHTTLQCSPAMTPALLDLYPNMPRLLEMGTETLRVCLKIVECHILLGAREFLQRYSSSLVESLSGLLTDLRSEGVVMVYKVVEVALKVLPEEAPPIFLSMLPSVFKSIVDGQEYPMVVTIHLTLFSRIILQNQGFFWEFLEQLGRELGCSSGVLVGQLLDSWFEKADNIIQMERKKLSALAMAALLTANVSAVLERFSGVICHCVETLHDVCRSDSDTGSQVDSLVMGGEGNKTEDELDTEHDKRKRKLTNADPVHTVSLRDFLMAQLNTCRQQHGEQGFNVLMELVDWEIAKELQDFLKS